MSLDKSTARQLFTHKGPVAEKTTATVAHADLVAINRTLSAFTVIAQS